jgi:orotidine-5'-phosphate decarboxylase
MAWEAGVRGFVTSAAEVRALRAAVGPDALLVTPGIRPAATGAGGHLVGRPRAPDDQKRIATPAQAIGDGADLIVVGRPIRDAADRVAAARGVVAEIARAASAG